MGSGPGQPGWYEDPSGEPGLFAYWDGSRWGERTRDAPQRPAMPLRATRPAGAHNRPVGLILAIAIAVFGVAVLILLVNR
ncbi:MAG: hypothetical protein DLM59_08925 [Pseudonocardiales bacterium]|nr:MAG: hypothetical protein DLM59_08925 [Pseudonocardiales bacterium]